MLDELVNLIRQNGQQAVVENEAVPNEHNEAIIQQAQTSIMEGLRHMNGPGQVSSLSESVQNGQVENNPAVQQISNNFMGNIMQKFGINASTAASIASSLIPVVLSKIVNKGNQEGARGFDLGALISSVTRGADGGNSASGGGLSGNLGSIGAKLGLDKDGDGDVDLNDLTKMFK